MDPLGLSLENFDLVGRWREQEDGHAIDAAAEMTDGTRLAGPIDLRGALLARSDAFVDGAHRAPDDLRTRARARILRPCPSCAASFAPPRRRAARLRALVQAIVASDSFQKRVKTGGGTRRPPAARISSIRRAGRSDSGDHNALPDRRSTSRGARCCAAPAWRSALPLLESMIPAGDPRRVGGRRAALTARVRLHSARLRHEPLDAAPPRAATSSSSRPCSRSSRFASGSTS